MMEQLKDLVKGMISTVKSSNEPEQYKAGAISAFEWVLKEIDQIMSK